MAQDATPIEPLVELRQVTRTFGSGAGAVHALAGVDLRIAAGDLVAIMGPSGSGKSTAMNILGCLDAPTSGDHLLHGRDVGRLPRWFAGRRRLPAVDHHHRLPGSHRRQSGAPRVGDVPAVDLANPASSEKPDRNHPVVLPSKC